MRSEERNMRAISAQRLWWTILMGGVASIAFSCGSQPRASGSGDKGGSAGSSEADAGTNSGSEHGGKEGEAGASSPGQGGRLGTGGEPSVSLAGSAGSETCGETALSSEQRPVNLVILLDRSGSMLREYTAGQDVTRWDTVREALRTTLSTLEGPISVGLKLFPDNDLAETCSVTEPSLEVDVQPLDVAVDAIDAAIGAALPSGGTPMSAGLDAVAGYFASEAGASLVGDRVILLATDGAPNCNGQVTCEATQCVTNIEQGIDAINLCEGSETLAMDCLDPERTAASIEALWQEGGQDDLARTIVMGIPGSDKPAYTEILDQLGSLGGLPNPDQELDYFPVDSSTGLFGLLTTLENITRELIVSCVLTLTGEPPDPRLLNVTVDGRAVPQSGADGWVLDATSEPMTITLLGATCDGLRADGAESITVTYGCPTIIR